MYLHNFAHCADVFKALAHPRRLEIVYLLQNQSLTVSEIFAMLDLPQANVSQHLTILKDANIVSAQKTGKQMSYALVNKNIVKACDAIRDFLAEQFAGDEHFATSKNPLTDMLPLTHDPVCQMQVTTKHNPFISQYAGKTYYFCASGCKKKFEESPQSYAQFDTFDHH